MRVPPRLKLLANDAQGRLWLDQLPQLISELEEQWELSIGAPFEDSSVSYVAPATRRGHSVVVKIQWPHEECRYEADALQIWNGHGAIELLAVDQSRHALLVERVSPGTHLSKIDGGQAMDVMIELLPKLWKSAGTPFKSLATEAQEWSDTLYTKWETDGQLCEKSLLDTTRGLISELAHSQGDQVLVHQDLHGENVISCKRRGWVAIDPKPLIGEREFSLSPVIRSFEFCASKAALLYRLDRLSDELSLDRERARMWAIVHSVAWSFGSAYALQHYQNARWLHAA